MTKLQKTHKIADFLLKRGELLEDDDDAPNLNHETKRRCLQQHQRRT